MVDGEFCHSMIVELALACNYQPWQYKQALSNCTHITLTYTLKSKTLTPLAKATNSDVLLNASEYTGLREFIPA